MPLCSEVCFRTYTNFRDGRLEIMEFDVCCARLCAGNLLMIESARFLVPIPLFEAFVSVCCVCAPLSLV